MESWIQEAATAHLDFVCLIYFVDIYTIFRTVYDLYVIITRNVFLMSKRRYIIGAV
jgi:hypothetical protein